MKLLPKSKRRIEVQHSSPCSMLTLPPRTQRHPHTSCQQAKSGGPSLLPTALPRARAAARCSPNAHSCVKVRVGYAVRAYCSWHLGSLTFTAEVNGEGAALLLACSLAIPGFAAARSSRPLAAGSRRDLLGGARPSLFPGAQKNGNRTLTTTRMRTLVLV